MFNLAKNKLIFYMIIGILAITGAAVLAGCAPQGVVSAPTQTPNPPKDVSENITLPAPSPTLTPTPKPSPSPSSTPTKVPTATDTPSPTPQPTSTATPRPIPQIEIKNLNVRACPATTCALVSDGPESGTYRVIGRPWAASWKDSHLVYWLPIDFDQDDEPDWVALVSGHYEQASEVDWNKLRTIEPSGFKSLCPMDVSRPDTFLSVPYNEKKNEGIYHIGVDVEGPLGEKIYTPDKGYIDYFGVDRNGAFFVILKILKYPPDEVTHIAFGHILMPEDTLDYYGLDKQDFYNPDGTSKINHIGMKPTKNLFYMFERGDFLHLYNGKTGKNIEHAHVHIGFWKDLGNYKWTDHIDPAKYIDCSEP